MSISGEITGKYEVQPQQLHEKLKGLPPETLQHFDLKITFAALLASGAQLTKLAEKIWRRVLDEAVAEHGGAYAPQKTGFLVDLWLEDLPAGAAKAKLGTLSNRMKDIYMKAHEAGPELNLDQLFVTVSEKENKQGPQVSADVARMIHQGLMVNPTPEVFDMWCTRTAQTVMMAQPKTPFVKEILDVVSKAELTYQPVWACANEMLVGSHAHIRVALPAGTVSTAEPVRQDLLMLFATCMQLAMMESKGVRAIGFIGLRAATLMHKGAMELLMAFFNTLKAEVKKDLLLEVTGLPKGSLSPSVKKGLEMLAPHVKAFMVDMGIFSKDDFSKDIPKLHANGFDLAGMALPEVEVAALVRKFAANQKGRAQKMYIKGVPSLYVAKVAKESGYTYLSGNAIHGADKFVTGMRNFPLVLPK
ncbi:MAG: hypothetical protein KGQ41_00995 [Alphaproteobacteria bacterium]|nr:hypothetical protein [Alphaproteobacteria bacterium]